MNMSFEMDILAVGDAAKGGAPIPLRFGTFACQRSEQQVATTASFDNYVQSSKLDVRLSRQSALSNHNLQNRLLHCVISYLPFERFSFFKLESDFNAPIRFLSANPKKTLAPMFGHMRAEIRRNPNFRTLPIFHLLAQRVAAHSRWRFSPCLSRMVS